jgi:hypothetical protein
MLEPLLRTASSIGLNLDVSSSKALAESLDNAKVKSAVSVYFLTGPAVEMRMDWCRAKLVG